MAISKSQALISLESVLSGIDRLQEWTNAGPWHCLLVLAMWLAAIFATCHQLEQAFGNIGVLGGGIFWSAVFIIGLFDSMQWAVIIVGAFLMLLEEGVRRLRRGIRR